MSNLESLTIHSLGEVYALELLRNYILRFAIVLLLNITELEMLWQMVNTPMVRGKFGNLRFLSIALGGVAYDFLSLASIFYASPCLETFSLNVITAHPVKINVVNYGGAVNLTFYF